MHYIIESSDFGCVDNSYNDYLMLESETAYSLFIGSNNEKEPLIWYKDYVNKPTRGSPLVRTLNNVKFKDNVIWKLRKTGAVEHTETVYLRNLTELSTGQYDIYIDTVKVLEMQLRTGAVYSVVISQNANDDLQGKAITVTEPNSLNILWLIPQYVVMTLGEVMFSVTGLEFSYSQAPLTMKSVLQACWLLTVAIGNIIVVIVAELQLFQSQANEFFLFAGLMFVDMLLFMLLAYRYQPNNPNDHIAVTTPKASIVSEDAVQKVAPMEGFESP